MRSATVKSLIIEIPFQPKKISIQTVIRKGIPTIKILGIPAQKSIEICTKLQTILLSNEINLPFENIQINITPSGIKHYANYLDFSILVSLLFAIHPETQEEIIQEDSLDNFLFLGEINLLGEIEYSNSLTSIIAQSYKYGFKKIFIPQANLEDTIDLVDLEYFTLTHMKDLIDKKYKQEKGKKKLVPEKIPKKEIQIPKNLIKILPILISGKHPVLILENQKLNKNSFLEQIQYLFTDMEKEESLEILIFNPNLKKVKRPFSKINPSIQKKELIDYPRNILLENQNGILFCEDISLFEKKTVLFFKELLEKNEVKIYTKEKEEFHISNKFWIFFSAQTCPCGNFLNPHKECTCTQKTIFEYIKKFIIHLKYQIEIYFYDVDFNFMSLKKEEVENMREKIYKAIQIQKNRFSNESFGYNSLIPVERVEEFCEVDSMKTKESLDGFLIHTNPYYEKKIILKIARTIADLKDHHLITKEDIIEATELRNIIYLYEEPTLKKTFP
ncbi:MAG: magnesium chelatase domain-containing protein [Leptonema sp. (in: bacteria)]